MTKDAESQEPAETPRDEGAPESLLRDEIHDLGTEQPPAGGAEPPTRRQPQAGPEPKGCERIARGGRLKEEAR